MTSTLLKTGEIHEKVSLIDSHQTAFDIGDDVTLTTNSSIARYLARSAPDMGLYGGDIQEKTEVTIQYS